MPQITIYHYFHGSLGSQSPTGHMNIGFGAPNEGHIVGANITGVVNWLTTTSTDGVLRLEDNYPQTRLLHDWVTIDVSQDVYDRLYASAVTPLLSATGNSTAINYDALPLYTGTGTNCIKYVWDLLQSEGMQLTDYFTPNQLAQTYAGYQVLNRYSSELVSAYGNAYTTESLSFAVNRLYAENIMPDGYAMESLSSALQTAYDQAWLQGRSTHPAALLQSTVVRTALADIRAEAVTNGQVTTPPPCFDGATHIAISSCESVPIAKIEVGDSILSFDAAGGLQQGRVTRLVPGVTTEWIVLNDGTRVTPQHRYLRPDGTFLEIRHILDRDGIVIDANGNQKHVTGTWLHATDVNSDATWIMPSPVSAGSVLVKPAPMLGWSTYNFTVEGLHTYIAGGVRVHNDCLGPDELLTGVDYHIDGTRTIHAIDEFGGRIEVEEYRDAVTGQMIAIQRDVVFDGGGDAVVRSVWTQFDDGNAPIGDPVQTVTFPDAIISGAQIGGIFGSAVGQAVGGGDVFATIGAQAGLSTVLGTMGHAMHIYFNDTHLSNVPDAPAATFEEAVAVSLNGVGASLGNNLISAGAGAISSFLTADNDNADCHRACDERRAA